MADNSKLIRVGSRKSQLALIQTHNVIDRLKGIHKNVHFEVITMTTTGDSILDTPLSKIGEKSLFTKELEVGLQEKKVDMVVHSLKDLPTSLPPGMVIGAICKRDDPHDAVVMHPKNKDEQLATLPQDSVIGTSSLRRAAQLKKKYPHLVFKDVRGNLNTRLRKLDEASDYDALILAKAGLVRMGWDERVSQVLRPDESMYAVGQGAMAVECREGDTTVLDVLAPLYHKETLLACVAERAFLKTLEGGCSVPVAVDTKVKRSEIWMQGGIFSLDGSESVVDELSISLEDNIDEPPHKQFKANNEPRQYACIVANTICQYALKSSEDLGNALAKKLLDQGGLPILTEAKRQTEVDILQRKKELEKLQSEKAQTKASQEQKQVIAS